MQGYFSLIQYSEYPERNEFVNIGVVLYADVSPRVLVKFSPSSKRAQRMFGVHLGKHFDLQKQSMEDRIKSEFSLRWNKEEIDRFVSLRSGKIRLSNPKSVLVKNPEKVLQDLFSRLVGDINLRGRIPSAHSKLKKQFSQEGVESLLEKPEPILLSQGVTIKAPYAYQNGSYNLINAISLREEPDQAIEKAGKFAVEGNWLHDRQNDGNKKLIIVADLEGQQPNFIAAVKELMERSHVDFYDFNSTGPLIEDIRKNVTIEQNPYFS